MRFLAWILSLLFAFNLGAESGTAVKETDDELRNKVQEHIDVIVDEGAAMVDDVLEEIRNDERVQEAEQFVENAKDVAEETLDELTQVFEDTKTRIEEKFGTGEEAENAETTPEEIPEAADPTPAAPAEPEQPGPGDQING